jgi:hypothetical protein
LFEAKLAFQSEQTIFLFPVINGISHRQDERTAGRRSECLNYKKFKSYLGPIPNGRKIPRSMNALTPPFSGENRSGSNCLGFGKYSGSVWIETIGIKMTEPFSQNNFLSFGMSTSTDSLQ